MMRELRDVFFYVSNVRDSCDQAAFFYAPNIQLIAPTTDGALIISAGRKYPLQGNVDIRQACKQLMQAGVVASPLLFFPTKEGFFEAPPLPGKLPRIAAGEVAVPPGSIVAITSREFGPTLETDSATLLLRYSTLRECRDALVPAGYRIIPLNPV